MSLVARIQIKAIQEMTLHLGKMVWALFLCFALFGSTSKPVHATYVQFPVLAQARTASAVALFSPATADDDESASYLFEEDSDDDDSDAGFGVETDLPGLEIGFPKVLPLHAGARFPAVCSLPLYILYCNWKYHLIV